LRRRASRPQLKRGPLDSHVHWDMESFSNRFTAQRYAADEPVTVGALGRDHDIPERLFTRAQAIASAYELHLLPTIDIHDRTGLNRQQCATLLDELAFLRSIISDPLLADHLQHLSQLAESCKQSPVEAQLTIEGP